MFSIWLQEKIKQKIKQKIYYATVNVNLSEENVIKIKSETTMWWVLMRVLKSIIYVKKDFIWNPSTCSC